MFDKLIETEPEGANFHNRRSYFMVSSIVVGILFATAVVISIYASDYGLGRDSFELSMIVTPPDIAPTEPLRPQPRVAANPTQVQNALPSKPAFVAPMSDPQKVPTGVSTAPIRAITWDSSDRVPDGSDIPTGSDIRRDTGYPSDTVGLTNHTEPTEPATIPDPPPPIKKDPPVKRPPVTGGVVNGNATSLPKPTYSAAAKAIGAQGKVDVQVTIDESGKVISAKAVSGHPLLRDSAERAAWQARFSPTLLTGAPVKVTGVIVYNFTK